MAPLPQPSKDAASPDFSLITLLSNFRNPRCKSFWRKTSTPRCPCTSFPHKVGLRFRRSAHSWILPCLASRRIFLALQATLRGNNTAFNRVARKRLPASGVLPCHVIGLRRFVGANGPNDGGIEWPKKVIVVTGASQGIGGEVVKEFRSEDYRVVATLRSTKPAPSRHGLSRRRCSL